MTTSPPTVTLYVSATQQPMLRTRLTTYLLHHHYAFLHTYHTPAQEEFVILQSHNPLLCLTLQSVDAPPPHVSSDLGRTVGTAMQALLRHLLQAVSPIVAPEA
jgi:hypothetical protein